MSLLGKTGRTVAQKSKIFANETADGNKRLIHKSAIDKNYSFHQLGLLFAGSVALG